jgi:gamma-glutamyltranspeptidase/glutathione hydrolase
LLEILNMLERFDLRQFGQYSPTVLHLFASAAQLAYADRAEYLGDPAFTSIPTGLLISKSYATRRGVGIDSFKRTPSSAIQAGQTGEDVEHQTTHYCVIDSAGCAVSVTITLNELFGNKLVVEGAGFFLNDEMDDFALKPGAANVYGLTGGDANGVRPGKRMLSTMTPTIVLKDGRPFLLLGGRGGSRIATSVAQVLINVIDFGMGITDAVAAPRIHHQWAPDTLYYERGIPHDALVGLDSLGYKCELVESGIAEIQAIELDPVSNKLVGGPDQREGGVALEYPAPNP